MDPGVIIALVVAGLLIGATGTWSPCGFSMIETIGPTGHTGGSRRPSPPAPPSSPARSLAPSSPSAASRSSAPRSRARPAGSRTRSPASSPSLAAIAEARGKRIAPQIRRQLPEHWRRIMPMPVAAALYGILLGLGFTTFVLTFGVWALAGISLALGEPVAGLAIGLRLRRRARDPDRRRSRRSRTRPFGRKAITLMAERPELYRAIRFGDALALVVAAAGAHLRRHRPGRREARCRAPSDPSVAGPDARLRQGPGRRRVRHRGPGPEPLVGTDPSIADKFAAVIDGPERPHPRSPRLRRSRFLRRARRRCRRRLQQLDRLPHAHRRP